ncbi:MULTISPECIES: O-antigen ligase [Microbacterium]|uniref:O-antigen ligase family protein n=1 Tax=Microbacterium TaxID=33882 RepID=UPI00277F355C|nr:MULTISPECIES: hypothetical protein [Microbacterium]MDQ1084627.1 O-antigen ligase [Microbacterium sp. SORGH_AS_0344]MDQ1170096.1 O-antigen ligase [Microbacterium proteolyticum]
MSMRTSLTREPLDAAPESSARTTTPETDDDVAIPLGRAVLATVILVAIAAVSVIFLPPVAAGGIMIFVALAVLARRILTSWIGWLGILVAVLMFIPIRRYALPIPLPFQLEAYRLVLLLMFLGMVAALLLDQNRKWKPVGFGWPFGLFFVSMIISIPMNGTELVEEGLASGAIGAIVNWVLLLSVFFIVRQIISTETIAMGLMTALVWCGTVVSVFATLERVTRVNLFWRLDTFLPLVPIAQETEAFRAGGYRSFASSQHPIALSVMFAILIPVAIYLARYGRWPRNEWSRRLIYSIAIIFLLLGIMAAVSRTAMIVLGVMFLLVLLLRPWLGVTLLALSIPALAVGMAALPKVFGTLVLSFLDIDGLIASQQTSPGFRGAGRLADLGPSLEQAAAHPFFGTGLGSRIVTGEFQNAYILDNQVLGTLLEVGAVGIVGLAIFILAPLLMMLAWAFTTARDEPRYAMLAFTLVLSGAGYTAALFFYDAFGFMQTFFVYSMLLAVGAWLLTSSPPALRARAAGEGLLVRWPRAEAASGAIA